MRFLKKEKWSIIIGIVIVWIILLFPIRMNLKDGGSVIYKSLTYEVTKIHTLESIYTGTEQEDVIYVDGLEVKIFGITIYSKTNR